MECKTSILCICLGILLIHTSPCVNLGVCVCLFVHACRLHLPTLIDETCQEFNCASLGRCHILSCFSWASVPYMYKCCQVLLPKAFCHAKFIEICSVKNLFACLATLFC